MTPVQLMGGLTEPRSVDGTFQLEHGIVFVSEMH
jgi:hypothetical protein